MDCERPDEHGQVACAYLPLGPEVMIGSGAGSSHGAPVIFSRAGIGRACQNGGRGREANLEPYLLARHTLSFLFRTCAGLKDKSFDIQFALARIVGGSLLDIQ